MATLLVNKQKAKAIGKRFSVEITIDIDRLRRDLENHFGTAAFSGVPVAMMDVWEIQRMSNEEVVDKALKEGFDLFRYQV